jgi:hypothetical protein
VLAVKKTRNRCEEIWQPSFGEMAAHARLMYQRETRLLTPLVLGESWEASCRAIGISLRRSASG